jgi:hypothetical protein
MPLQSSFRIQNISTSNRYVYVGQRSVDCTSVDYPDNAMLNTYLRPATAADAASICAIYNSR